MSIYNQNISFNTESIFFKEALSKGSPFYQLPSVITTDPESILFAKAPQTVTALSAPAILKGAIKNLAGQILMTVNSKTQKCERETHYVVKDARTVLYKFLKDTKLELEIEERYSVIKKIVKEAYVRLIGIKNRPLDSHIDAAVEEWKNEERQHHHKRRSTIDTYGILSKGMTENLKPKCALTPPEREYSVDFVANEVFEELKLKRIVPTIYSIISSVTKKLTEFKIKDKNELIKVVDAIYEILREEYVFLPSKIEIFPLEDSSISIEDPLFEKVLQGEKDWGAIKSFFLHRTGEPLIKGKYTAFFQKASHFLPIAEKTRLEDLLTVINLIRDHLSNSPLLKPTTPPKKSQPINMEEVLKEQKFVETVNKMAEGIISKGVKEFSLISVINKALGVMKSHQYSYNEQVTIFVKVIETVYNKILTTIPAPFVLIKKMLLEHDLEGVSDCEKFNAFLLIFKKSYQGSFVEIEEIIKIIKVLKENNLFTS